MKRIFLFLVTNMAILLVLGTVLQLLGIESVLDQQGVDLDLGALLVFSAVFGFGGSLLSLAISKWTAKRMMGVQMISEPRSEEERWLVETVRRQAGMARIGMPEVGVFDAAEPNAFARPATVEAWQRRAQ